MFAVVALLVVTFSKLLTLQAPEVQAAAFGK